MFSNTSMAGTGVAITLIMLAIKLLGLDIDEGQVTEVVTSGGQVVGFVLLVIGQVKRKDLKFGLLRK